MRVIDRIKSNKGGILQFIRFNVVGVFNTLIDFSAFLLLTRLGMPYRLAHVISYSCGLVNSFVWNKLWTFASREGLRGTEALKFIIVNLGSLGVSLCVLTIFRDSVQLPVMIAKAIAVASSVALNFTGNKLWVFKR